MLKESATTTDEEALLRQQVFERLNTGGVELTNQEIRHCIYHCQFDDLLIDLTDPRIRLAWGLPLSSTEEESNPPPGLLKNRFYSQMRDAEVILRFFALRHAARSKGGMQTFLDHYMVRARRFSEEDIAFLRDVFVRAPDLASEIYGEHLFHLWDHTKQRWTDRAQIAYTDAVLVAFSQLLPQQQALKAPAKSRLSSRQRPCFPHCPPGLSRASATLRRTSWLAFESFTRCSMESRPARGRHVLRASPEARHGLRVVEARHKRQQHTPHRGLRRPGRTRKNPILAAVAAACPSRVDWQLFDHCAGVTRLYALYEKFVEDLVTAYVDQLPSFYPIYSGLPKPTQKQHRVGVGQLLHKWSESGLYGHLTKDAIAAGLADGLRGTRGYRLLSDAFLIEVENYRPTALTRLFGYLDFQDCLSYVRKHPGLRAFMAASGDTTETLDSILTTILRLRNEAAPRVPCV